MRQTYPFTAIVGQERMKRALLLNAINPQIGGVLIRGERGTAKSTAARALAALLPPMEVVQGCRFNCDPTRPDLFCDECRERFEREGALRRPPPVHPVCGSAGKRHGRSRGGHAGHRKGHPEGRAALRAWRTGRGESRRALCRRGQSARRPRRGPAAGQRGHGRQHRGAGRNQLPAPGALRPRRLHEPGGRRPPPTVAGSLCPRGGRGRHHRARPTGGGAPPACLLRAGS